MCRVLIAFGWALLVAASPARAADERRWESLADTAFQHIQQPDSSGPTAFAEDGAGFLWVGTQGGLARWDGYRFRRFRPDPHMPGSLPDSFIVALHSDARGRLWVGTNAGGLARYDANNDRFVTYAAGPGGLSHARIVAIADDGAGGLWLATDAGLDHLDPDSGTVRHEHLSGQPGHNPSDHSVLALRRDRAGTLWLATRKGVLRSDGGAGRFVPVPLPAAGRDTPVVTSLYEDHAGRIWVGTAGHGAFVIEPAAGVRQLRESVGRSGLQTDEVLDIAEVRRGEVWLGTNGQGIAVVDTSTWQTRRLRHDPTRPTSLAGDNIAALYRDRAGMVWVGSDSEVSRHDPQNTAVSSLFGGSKRRNGISRSSVSAMLAAPDGRLWLSSGDEGAEILDPVHGRIARLQPEPARPESALPKGRVLAMALGPDGDIFLGTKGGLYRTDRFGRHIRRIHIPHRSPSAAVWSLFADPGVLWIGGHDGLWTLDLGSGTAVRHPAADRLSDQRVMVMARGADDSLWIGTRNGLNRLDPGTGTFEQLMPSLADPHALASGFVVSLENDAQGRLWVATLGGGIGVLEPREAGAPSRLRRIDMTHGLPNNSVNKLLRDARGWMWASTDDGLARIDPMSFAVRALRQSDGVMISTYWSNSGAATAQGELLFGGLGGLTVVRPDLLADAGYRAPVVVTDLQIEGKRVPEGRINAGGSAATLTIPAGAKSLAVEFSALDFSAPERNRYAYRLDGFDTEWTSTDASRRLAAYTNLPPGDYVLRLRGSNRNGTWTEPPLALPLRVLPAWYQTLWFQLGAGLATLALLATLVQARTAYLRQRQRQLEHQVAERTAELQASQRQLEQIAYRDVLTGLPNRRMFSDDFRKRLALARRQGDRMALLLIDLDRFKVVNDTLGHDAGDALLVEASTRLRSAVRHSDLVARLGGDEFAILAFEGKEPFDTESVCKRVIESFNATVQFKGKKMHTSPSIGVAVFPDHGEDQDALYKAADLALYDAKRAGRNAWRWYRGELRA